MNMFMCVFYDKVCVFVFDVSRDLPARQTFLNDAANRRETAADALRVGVLEPDERSLLHSHRRDARAHEARAEHAEAIDVARMGRRIGHALILLERVAGEERSEEHTSELQSHSFISYAVFCLKK